MAENERIKVIGYAQRKFYNDGIEYRNFSDDLVGNQQTTGDGGANSTFTLNNFVTTTNFDGRTSKVYYTKKYSDFYTLQGLKLTNNTSKTLLSNNINVDINIDKTDLSKFAYFGSATEFIRVNLENIITNWPASLYIKPTRSTNIRTMVGPTVLDYTYDDVLNKSTFKVDTNFIDNKFGINFQKNGTIINTFNESNNLRNLSINSLSYVISTELGDFNVIGFTGSNNLIDDFIYFEVEGNPFDITEPTTNETYHIKPNEILYESFFNSLSKFESNLLNRLINPIFTSTYNYKTETDDGLIINRTKTLTWPVSDGYNIDFNTEQYVEYVTELLKISESKDEIQSNLVARFFTSQSISDFDTIPTIDVSGDEASGQKMNKTLKIYGREFDEVKKYIDGISFSNIVTYDKKNNTPDQLVKYLGRTLGWNMVSSMANNDLLNSYLNTSSSTYIGYKRGLTPNEADIEMWRRLVLNSAWIWKSKGTRKVIEFFFKLVHQMV